jgi:hypothetical protein
MSPWAAEWAQGRTGRRAPRAWVGRSRGDGSGRQLRRRMGATGQATDLGRGARDRPECLHRRVPAAARPGPARVSPSASACSGPPGTGPSVSIGECLQRPARDRPECLHRRVPAAARPGPACSLVSDIRPPSGWHVGSPRPSRGSRPSIVQWGRTGDRRRQRAITGCGRWRSYVNCQRTPSRPNGWTLPQWTRPGRAGSHHPRVHRSTLREHRPQSRRPSCSRVTGHARLPHPARDPRACPTRPEIRAPAPPGPRSARLPHPARATLACPARELARRPPPRPQRSASSSWVTTSRSASRR